MRFLFLLLLVLPTVAMANQDDDFLAARDAFRRGNAIQLDRVAERLKNSPLEPYLTNYQLRMHWDEKDTTSIKQFLSRVQDTPIIDQFRGDWLRYLGKQQRWDDFASEYPRLIAHDAELDCYALQLLQLSDESSALETARKLWFSSNKKPQSCITLFDSAIHKNVISAQDIWARIRLSLEAGNVSLVRKLAKKLPKRYAFSTSALHKAASNPRRYLRRAKFNSEARRLIALFALSRLARHSTHVAYKKWKKISRHFSKAEQQYFYGALAYRAARSLNPRALDWYRKAGDSPLSAKQSAWRARAALREQDWHEVWKSIVAMSPQQQNTDTWRYWKARAFEKLGFTSDAEALLIEVSQKRNFYGLLAAEELGLEPARGFVTPSFQASREDIYLLQSLPGIQRTLALYRMDLRTEAAREWIWTTRNFDDNQLLVAAELARRNSMYDRSINAADRTATMHDVNLSFPAPYRDHLQRRLREHDLEEAWVYGLMRQESRFVTHAKSVVGAAGLMQIMPATAKWIAKKMGIRHYRKAMIHDTEMNLRLGTYYMKNVLSSFDNNAVMASAAYNAGPGRARQWRGKRSMEGAIYAETIPFDETRGYVKKVMSNTVYYSWLFGQPTISLKERLGIIEGKDSNFRKVRSR
ncbi:MAG: transglycosylase SLT domain-containing protein [Gallionellaceae bacterium]